jgi:hypothetical protein
MPLQNHQGPSATPGRLTVIGILISLLLGIFAWLILVVPENNTVQAPQTLPSSSIETQISRPPPRLEVVSRLQEILQIREEAYRSRNPEMLRSIYSTDCPCLVSDEEGITELLNRNLRWDGISTSIEVQSVKEINRRLSTISAIFRSKTLRIETEGGRLVRIEPAGSNLFEFTLVKPRESQQWLLGLVSAVEG